MSSHFNKQLKLKRRFTSEIRNLFTNIERFKWSHVDMLVSMKNIRSAPEYKQLTQLNVMYLTGVYDECLRRVESLHGFAYYVDSENGLEPQFLLIDSDAYRKIKPQRIHEAYSNQGASVWRDDPSKVWYGFKMEQRWL